MTVYEVLETYCKNCAHNGNCWKPCAAATSAVSAVMSDEKMEAKTVWVDDKKMESRRNWILI